MNVSGHLHPCNTFSLLFWKLSFYDEQTEHNRLCQGPQQAIGAGLFAMPGS
jgi:hypothetical protein